MSYLIANTLSKHYGEAEAKVTALGGVSLALDQGEFVALMGPSGSGKSTLLGLLGALATPDGGSYQVDGIDVFGLGSDRRADFRREYLGFVFQSFHLVPYLTLAENVMLPLVTKSLPRREKRDLARAALERVGLAGKADRLPNQVSGGEQERAAIARAVVNAPPILLADEPTGNLDQATSCVVMEHLAGLNREGMTVVMVTHSQESAAFAGRVIRMCDGRLEDPPAQVCRAACAAV